MKREDRRSNRINHEHKLMEREMEVEMDGALDREMEAEEEGWRLFVSNPTPGNPVQGASHDMPTIFVSKRQPQKMSLKKHKNSLEKRRNSLMIIRQKKLMM